MTPTNEGRHLKLARHWLQSHYLLSKIEPAELADTFCRSLDPADRYQLATEIEAYSGTPFPADDLDAWLKAYLTDLVTADVGLINQAAAELRQLRKSMQ